MVQRLTRASAPSCAEASETGTFYDRQNVPVFFRPAYGRTSVKVTHHAKDPTTAKATRTFSYTLSARLRAQLKCLKGGVSNKKSLDDEVRLTAGLGRIEADFEKIARIRPDGITALPDLAPWETAVNVIRPMVRAVWSGRLIRTGASN